MSVKTLFDLSARVGRHVDVPVVLCAHRGNGIRRRDCRYVTKNEDVNVAVGADAAGRGRSVDEGDLNARHLNQSLSQFPMKTGERLEKEPDAGVKRRKPIDGVCAGAPDRV